MQDTQFKNELIDIIDEKITENGEGLPEVTAANNGMVLGVDDGEWKAVEPSGGADIIIGCVGSAFSSTATDYTLIKCSYQDIVTKLREGKLVTGYAYSVYDYFETSEDMDSANILTLRGVMHNEYAETLEVNFFCMDSITVSGGTLTSITVRDLNVHISSDGNISQANYKIGTKGF